MLAGRDALAGLAARWRRSARSACLNGSEAGGRAPGTARNGADALAVYGRRWLPTVTMIKSTTLRDRRPIPIAFGGQLFRRLLTPCFLYQALDACCR